MKLIRNATHLFLALTLACSMMAIGVAQQAVTSAELQRLTDNIAEISKELPTVRGRDAALAGQLQTQLNDASDDAAYMRVKLRRNEAVTRSEYLELLDRIDTIRARARGETRPPAPVTKRASDAPAGTEFDVKLRKGLSSSTAAVEDHFEATTLVDLMAGSRTIVPAGSIMRGTVTAVNKAGHVDRKASISIAFDRITIGSTSYVIDAKVTQAIEGEGYKGDAAKIGAGAGVGAVIGGILGGFKGAMAGILVGGGGVVAATEGKDVVLPAGSVLRVKLESGLDLK